MALPLAATDACCNAAILASSAYCVVHFSVTLAPTVIVVSLSRMLPCGIQMLPVGFLCTETVMLSRVNPLPSSV